MTARLRTLAVPAGVVVAVAAITRLVTGPAYIGYDAIWALVWGRQMARGQLPAFESAGAPTPHPLPNLASAALSPLGTGPALDVVLATSFLAFGGLAWFSWRLGRAVAGRWVGLMFAALVVSRPTLLLETPQALLDVPFLMFVSWAAALEAETPRRGRAVLLLLGIAGLLRPEGWLLAAIYGLWMIVGSETWAARARWALAAAAAPVIWLLFDLAVTGDPLHSLHGTQELAADLQRPRELDTALAATPFYLKETLGSTMIWVGLGGVLVALVAGLERSLVPLAAGGLGLLAFLVLGVSDLPLLTRYLLQPALVLALFAAVAVLGWTHLPHDHPWRRRWAAAGAALALVLLAGTPAEVDRLRSALQFTGARADAQRDLEALVDGRAVRAAAARCDTLDAPDHRAVPLLAWWLDRDLGLIDGEAGPPQPGALVLAYSTAEASYVFSIGYPPPEAGLPSGFTPLEANRSWVAAACA